MTLRWLGIVGMVTLLLCSTWADRRRDPLTQDEIDQLRDAAQDPEQRLKLFVTFARTRLTAMEQARSDPKAADRAQKTHDDLQDFLDIYDELNDNIDTFVGRKADLRKPLKFVIQADTEFQAKLRALQDAADVPAQEANRYEFVLSTALDTVDSSTGEHRKLLADQEEAAKHKKLNSPEKNGGKPERK